MAFVIEFAIVRVNVIVIVIAIVIAIATVTVIVIGRVTMGVRAIVIGTAQVRVILRAMLIVPLVCI